MTTQYSLAKAISGQTGVGAKLFARGTSDVVLYTAASGAEGTNKKGQYNLTWSTLVAAGNYTQVLFSSGGVPLSIGDRTFTGVDLEVATDTPATAELDPASVTAVQSGLATSASITALRGADNDTLKTLSDQIDGIDGGAGLTGPYTRTITVTDADDDSPIEAAKVRLYRTGETETKATDSDGETSFTAEAATFSYAVTANGYGGVSGTIVISANGATTIELTATTVTPPTNPDLSAVVVSCLGTDFEPEAGVTIDLRIITLPSGSTNTAYPGLKQTATSNGSGIATLEAPKGSVCEWKRGKEDSWTEITIGSDDQTNVTSIIGSRY